MPANAGRPAGRPRCSTALGDAADGTAARTPSASTADAADDAGPALEPLNTSDHAEAGPREVLTPERSSRGAERRFRSAALFTRSPQILHGPTTPPSTPHASGSRGSAKMAPSLAATDRSHVLYRPVSPGGGSDHRPGGFHHGDRPACRSKPQRRSGDQLSPGAGSRDTAGQERPGILRVHCRVH